MIAPPCERCLAPLGTRLLSLVYEGLILFALLLVATGMFTAAFGDSGEQPVRAVLQVYLLLVAGSYFVWSWSGGRRTLPMRTWRMRLVDRCGRPAGLTAAVIRYLAAIAGIALCGIGLLWAAFDRDRVFLHDRLAGTRLVSDPPESPRR